MEMSFQLGLNVVWHIDYVWVLEGTKYPFA